MIITKKQLRRIIREERRKLTRGRLLKELFGPDEETITSAQNILQTGRKSLEQTLESLPEEFLQAEVAEVKEMSPDAAAFMTEIGADTIEDMLNKGLTTIDMSVLILDTQLDD